MAADLAGAACNPVAATVVAAVNPTAPRLRKLRRFNMRRPLFGVWQIPGLEEKLHHDVMYFPPSQQGQTRLVGAMDGALHAKFLASLVDQLGIVGMMDTIIEPGSGVENDRGPILAQLRISHQRSAHGLLKGEDRTKRKIMAMS